MNTVDPITATYAHDDADWTITVSGLGKELTDRAPGIIAARDRADQLVEKVAPERGGRTVVHLLNGSALDFTAAYIEARLTTPATQSTDSGSTDSGSTDSASASGKDATEETAKMKPEATGANTESSADSADASERKEPAVATAASAS
ncbi:hypothetical protein [Haloechinothrix salitolerans]|uniref:DUF2188 domain-containing protein n=1 Tax=Haloechinothrix salitolerans TaxID=926830 RepID=A0ABW2C5J2_9PSEU